MPQEEQQQGSIPASQGPNNRETGCIYSHTRQGRQGIVPKKSMKSLTNGQFTTKPIQLWDPIVFDCSQMSDEKHHAFLREEFEAAVSALKSKSAEIDNTGIHVQQEGTIIDIMTSIFCTAKFENRRMQWPTT